MSVSEAPMPASTHAPGDSTRMRRTMMPAKYELRTAEVGGSGSGCEAGTPEHHVEHREDGGVAEARKAVEHAHGNEEDHAVEVEEEGGPRRRLVLAHTLDNGDVLG